MKKRGLIKQFEYFELHHKIICFILILAGTILLTRIIVLIRDFNPLIGNFELHHFDYGIALLIFSALLLLFVKKRIHFHLILSAIAIGLIIDQYWFMRKSIDEMIASQALYNSTFPEAIILLIIIVLAIFLINSLSKRTKNNLQ